MKLAFFFMISLISSHVFCQTGWTWTELDTMPQPISNNAVSEGINANGDTMVYSFAGIDSTKTHSDIVLSSFSYNYTNSSWSTIAPLPDTMGKIAAAANTVNNKVYIIGGYHVLANGNEVSSNSVHIFDPVTNSYLADGTPIPVPIDDQVQCVWRDSLIFVVTGWSNTTNVTNVQIYDPANDSWQVGTPTPTLSAYRMFGSSGVIVGDTIFYNGGSTSGFNFNSVPYLRKGIIDSNDPTQITWSQEENNPGAAGYRMAAAKYQERCFWIGGSGKAYNYNGIAYDGSGGVEPLQRILRYESGKQMWDEGLGAPYGVMDLRSVAQISPTSWILCGGMLTGQVVSNKTFLLEYDPILGGYDELQNNAFDLYPNPAINSITVDGNYSLESEYTITSSEGKTVQKGSLSTKTIMIDELPKGQYFMQIKSPDSIMNRAFIKE